MSDINVVNKVKDAAKWSTITQLTVKLITPITNLILARILSPEAFGVIAVVMMVISFTDIFTDSGLQKYLIQHEFKDENDKINCVNVAFWTSLAISLFLWIAIIVFRNPIADFMGNSELGNALAIACIQLPINSLWSIQTALYIRSFNYKDLFIGKIVSALIPLLVTIPLAYGGFGYWSIIIGSTSSMASDTIILSLKSRWKPSFYYNFRILKEMFVFGTWSLLEGISIWLTSSIDIIIIGNTLSDYYLGLYSTSLNMVNGLMAIITTAIMPILYAAMSRLQNNEDTFNTVFLGFQKIIAYLLFPLGTGLFLYRELATDIILGSKWEEASNILGVWAITTVVRIVMVNIYSETFRAKGKPKLSLILQMIDLILLVPTCIISLHYGFWPFVYSRALLRFDLIVPGLIFMRKIIHIETRKILKNISKPVICTGIMMITALGLQHCNNSFWWSIFSIGVCIVIYFIAVLLFDKGIVHKFVRLIKNVSK